MKKSSEALFKWFSQQRMKQKALDFQKQLQHSEHDFTTNVGLLERWKKNVVSQLNISWEKLS
jgi:hypothetical protein